MSQSGPLNSTGEVQVPAANKQLSLVDDFITNGDTSNLGQLKWPNLGFLNTPGTALHPGIIVLTPAASNAGIILNDGNNPNGSFNLGGGVLSVNFVISLVTLSTNANSYKVYLGLTDATSSSVSAPTNGVYFSYTHTEKSGHWAINTMNSSVETSTDSTVVAGTGYVNLGFNINAAASRVDYFINSVSVGSITTHIPSVATSLAPFALWINNAGNIPASIVDLFYLTYNLTVAR